MSMIYQIVKNTLGSTAGACHLQAVKTDALGRYMRDQPFTQGESEEIAQVTGLTFTDIRTAFLCCKELNKQIHNEQ